MMVPRPPSPQIKRARQSVQHRRRIDFVRLGLEVERGARRRCRDSPLAKKVVGKARVG